MSAQIVIAGNQKGLDTRLRPFLLSDGAYPTMVNIYSDRERLQKKPGHISLGRLRRLLSGESLGNTDGAGSFAGSLQTSLSLEINAQIEPGSVSVTVGAQNFADTNSDGQILTFPGGVFAGQINYSTTFLTFTTSPPLAVAPITISLNYFPSLPVLGVAQREVPGINQEETVVFNNFY